MVIDTLTTILGLYIFLGSMLAFLQGAVRFSIKKRSPTDFFYTSLFILTSVLLLEHYITMYLKAPFTTDYFSLQSLILYFIKFMKPFAGPVLYMHIKTVIDIQFKFKKIYLLHFLPALLTELYLVTSYILKTGSSDYAFLFLYIDLLHNLLLIHLLAYVILTLSELLAVWRNLPGKMYRQLIYGLVVTIVILISIVVLSLNVLWGQLLVETTAPLLMSTLIIVLYFFENKYSNIIEDYNREIKKARYIRSNINNVDKTNIEIRLKELMRDDKLYCDEDLSLSTLAKHVMLTPHQLSEVLNSHFGQNFKSFINSYRVNEVKELLLEHPNRSVTHIAFSAGFNSLSSMYKNFSGATGISPGEYRKLNQK